VELDGRYDAGMPIGTAAVALVLAERAAEAASSLTGVRTRVEPLAVLAHLLAPLVVGEPPTPAPPQPAPGGGHVHADVSAEYDELFVALAAQEPMADAEVLAERAQACSLAVTPYLVTPAPWRPDGTPEGSGRVVRPSEITVIDMTAMWAGPLCTQLLADWGAGVLTVEPVVRPDGLRGSPAWFGALDRGKRRVPWDLRAADDRLAFEQAVSEADVLVESFSWRVLPDLGYSSERLHHINPRLTIVAIRAFPSTSPHASWVAYGRGVHAASGLGVVRGQPVPALLGYPDALAGLQAFVTVLGALGGPGGTIEEVSLAGAISPLLPSAGRPLGTVDADAIAGLPMPGPVLVR
jgi:hypothetical protein